MKEGTVLKTATQVNLIIKNNHLSWSKQRWLFLSLSTTIATTSVMIVTTRGATGMLQILLRFNFIYIYYLNFV